MDSRHNSSYLCTKKEWANNQLEHQEVSKYVQRVNDLQ